MAMLDEFKDGHGIIDLPSAYKKLFGKAPDKTASLYLSAIQTMQPLTSKQAAAVALVTANVLGIIARHPDENG